MGWLDWIPGMGAKKNLNSPRNAGAGAGAGAGANGSTMAVMNALPGPVAPMNMVTPSAPTVGGRRSTSRSSNGRRNTRRYRRRESRRRKERSRKN